MKEITATPTTSAPSALWTLNQPMRETLARMASLCIQYRQEGEAESARHTVIRIEAMLRGYFLATGVVIPEEEVEAMRRAFISEAKSNA